MQIVPSGSPQSENQHSGDLVFGYMVRLFYELQGGSSTRRRCTQAVLGVMRGGTGSHYAVNSCNVSHVTTQSLQMIYGL